MKVLIAPLFPRQYEWLRQVYDGPHELEYLDSAKSEGPRVLATKAERADKVVVLTKFISHSHWHQIPRDKVIHCDSVNLDRMLHILEQLPEDEEGDKPAPSKEPKVRLVAPKAEPSRRPPMSTSTTREVNGFVLTTAVPVPETRPKGGPKPVFPLAEMRVGESFWIDAEDKAKQRGIASRLSVAAVYLRKKNPHLRFKTSVKQEGGVRCWRLPDYTDEELRTKTPVGRASKKKKTK